MGRGTLAGVNVGGGDGIAEASDGAVEEELSRAAFAPIIQVMANTEVIAAVAIARASLRFRGAGVSRALGRGGPSVRVGRAR